MNIFKMYWIIINERGQSYKGPQGFTEKNETTFIFPSLSFFQQSCLCLLAIHFVSVNVDIARFCHTWPWISHRYTYVPSFLNLPPTSQPIPPLQVVTEHWVELPASYTKFPLASYFTYGNIPVSMLLWILFTFSFPLLCVQLCSLSLLFSITTLPTGSSVPFF